MRRLSLAALPLLGAAIAVMIPMLGVPAGRVDYRAFAELYHYGGTPTAGYVHVALDCDLTQNGTQDNCIVPSGVPTVDVGITIANSTGSASDILAFNVKVTADEPILDPLAAVDGNKDGNPDFNDALTGAAGFACNSPSPNPDDDPNPSLARSTISCFNQDGPWAPLPNDSDHILLAVIHYAAVSPGIGITTLTLSDVDVFNSATNEIHSCAPVVTTEGRCLPATVTVLGSEDPDGDNVLSSSDNCSNHYNPGQSNYDRNFIDLTPPKANDDLTRAHSDLIGDACDPDGDNDGLNWNFSYQETCAYATGALSAFDEDTDGDRYLDGAECALYSDPTNPASVPAPPPPDVDKDGVPGGIDPNDNDVDSDDDGLRDGIEFRRYNTSMINTNTDGDTCGDAREVMSVDNNATVNAADLGLVASAFGVYGTPASPANEWRVNMDVDKNGAVNAADLGLVASKFGACP